MPLPVRVAYCVSCRADRPAKRLTGVVLAGVPHDVLRCPELDCELLWCARAERPRLATAA